MSLLPLLSERVGERLLLHYPAEEAVVTSVVAQAHVATVEVQVIGVAATSRTGPIVAARTTVNESASSAVRIADSWQEEVIGTEVKSSNVRLTH